MNSRLNIFRRTFYALVSSTLIISTISTTSNAVSMTYFNGRLAEETYYSGGTISSLKGATTELTNVFIHEYKAQAQAVVSYPGYQTFTATAPANGGVPTTLNLESPITALVRCKWYFAEYQIGGTEAIHCKYRI